MLAGWGSEEHDKAFCRAVSPLGVTGNDTAAQWTCSLPIKPQLDARLAEYVLQGDHVIITVKSSGQHNTLTSQIGYNLGGYKVTVIVGRPVGILGKVIASHNIIPDAITSYVIVDNSSPDHVDGVM